MTALDHRARMRGTDRPSATPSTFARTTVAGVALTGVAFTAACGTVGGDEAQEEYVPARSLTMAFGGDVMFESHLRPLAYDEDSLSELRSTLGAADLSVVNTETSLTVGGSPWPGKPFTFRAPTSALDAVAGAGVDAVTMANNHAFDFGDAAAEDTLAAKDDSPHPRRRHRPRRGRCLRPRHPGGQRREGRRHRRQPGVRGDAGQSLRRRERGRHRGRSTG